MRRLAVAALAAAAIAGTAGTAHAKPQGPAHASGTAGIYAGTTRHHQFPGPKVSKPQHLFGGIASDGNGYFIAVPAASSEIRVFRQLDATGAISSPEYEVPTAGNAPARGPRSWKMHLEAQHAGRGDYSLHGKFNSVDGYLALHLRRLPSTRRATPLAERSGPYRGVDVNRGTRARITLDAKGRFHGTDADGCRLSGALTRTGQMNLFAARVTLSGGAACQGEMQGVAFFAGGDRTGRLPRAKPPFLYLIASDGDFSHGMAMELSRRPGTPAGKQ